MKTTQTYKIGDCLELISELKNVQMIVTSPPYFNSAKKYQRGNGFHYSKDVGEPLYTIVSMMELSYPVIKKDGMVFLNLGYSYDRGVMQPYYIIHEILKRTNWFCVDIIIWHKKNPIPLQNRLTNAFEYIFVFGKKPISQYKREIVYEHNVWDFNVRAVNQKNNEEHYAMFPSELPKKCIELGSIEGELILDPFLGSGTTLRACRETNRNGIGFEINPDYESIIRRQLMADTPSLETWA